MLEIMRYPDADSVVADIENIRKTVSEVGAAVIRGVLSGERMRNAVNIMQEQFDARNDVRTVHPFTASTPDYHRLDIGAYGPYGKAPELFRFARIFYYFPWNQNNLDLSEELVTMSRIRNLLSGMNQDHGLNIDIESGEEGFCYTFCVNHYPKGGGFMAGHVDPTNFTQKEFSSNFVVATPMSKIGTDFSTGGSWAVIDNERISWESMTELGDILIYDQEIMHGVDAVDQREDLDVVNLSGRLFAFASPTKYSA
jgi:hypothetical protein